MPTDYERRQKAKAQDEARKAGYQQFKNASYQRGVDARAHDRKYSKTTQQDYTSPSEMQKCDERLWEWRAERAKKKQSALQEEARKATESTTQYFTAADYYEKAYNLHHGNNCPIDKPQAAQTYWKALICGDGRAAFDLFVMLYNGDGIAQNHELSGIMCLLAARASESRIQEYRGVFNFTEHQRKIVSNIDFELPLHRNNTLPGGINQQISPKLFSILKSNVDEATKRINPKFLDGNIPKLSTDLHFHTIDEYLVTPDQLPYDNINETTHLIGNSDSDYLCEGCVIF